jgi:hypothetical protein
MWVYAEATGRNFCVSLAQCNSLTRWRSEPYGRCSLRQL